MTFDVGVIGCGYFGRFHLGAWRALSGEGVRLAAVCDADAARAEAAAREFGAARWYADPEAMLASERLGLIDIATRMDSHDALVRAALATGTATVVQKPMAPSIDVCAALVALAGARGTFFAVHENFRFQPAMQRVAEIIASGEIGRPTWARISVRAGPQVYASQPYFHDEARLVILDLGIHLIDLARVFLGEVERVSCEAQRRNDRVRGEDTATLMLRHANGAVAVADCTYENQRGGPVHTSVEIEASAGGIVTLPDGGLSVTGPEGRREEPAPASRLPGAALPLLAGRESVYLTCRHLLDAVRRGVPAATDGADNLRTFAVVEAAYAAAAEGRAVRPRYGGAQ